MLGFGVSAEVFSGVAVAMSMYSLWRTSLKRADLRVFVSPLIRYASPYQNSVFEVFEIPLTVINEGAQRGRECPKLCVSGFRSVLFPLCFASSAR